MTTSDSTSPLYLGIEIGGTKLQLAVGAGDGSPFVKLERAEIDAARGAEGIREQILHAGRFLMSRHDVARIGIGFGGPIDSAAGRTITSHQVPGWDDFPLVEWCGEKLGKPAVLGNDCDVAALAEARFGAGRGHRVVFFTTVGTGVGGGLVIDGTLYQPGQRAVAEIGHLRPGLAAADVHQTVEAAASGRGIERAMVAKLEGALDPQLTGASLGGEFADDRLDLLSRCGGLPDLLTAVQIGEAAANGNALALEVLGHATETLGWAVAQVVTLVAPGVVVVGGGVSLMGEELFFEPVRRAASRYVFPPLQASLNIVPAALGERVVVQGALALASSGV